MNKGNLPKILIIMLVVGLLGGLLFGCGGNGAPSSDTGNKEGDKAVAPSRLERISIATGGTGGTYYPYGGAMGEIINKYVDGLDASVEVTGASVENARLLDSGESSIGLLMDDVVYMAINGKGPFDKEIELRTLMEMYPHSLHVVAIDGKKAKSISDLKGLKVSVGAPGSGTETMANEVLTVLDVPYDSFNVFRLSFAENTQALRDHVIDVGIWSVGAPTSSVMDLATTHKPHYIGFTEKEVQRVLDEKPYYGRIVIPAGTYDKQTEDILTLAVWNTVTVHKRMPVEQAYEISKALFENVGDIVRVYPGAKATTPENLINYAVAPLHPGVIKYLEEIGLEVPDHLIPPEMK